MDTLSVTAIIVGVFALFFIIKKMVTKSSRKKDKHWIILEHSEEKDGESSKCYLVQNKKTQEKSPCFKEKQKLNKWLNENAE